jgi:hypothetical protein
VLYISSRAKELEETTYNTVEFCSLVTLRPTICGLGFACAKLAKVFCRARCDIGKELKLDSAKRFS